MINNERTKRVLGEEFNGLIDRHVLIFGVGGVGGSLCESLLRLGLREITFVDRDVVESSNANRQIVATEEVFGEKKVLAMEKRLRSISSDAMLHPICADVTKEWLQAFDPTAFDAICDCIDTVSAKLALYAWAQEHRIPLISALGAGNRIDPTALEVTKLSKTSMDPLARVMRREVKKRGLKDVTVVASREAPKRAQDATGRTPGSTPFVPPAAGLVMGSALLRSWMGEIVL